MQKEIDIYPLLKQRWSPKVFSKKMIHWDDLMKIFEAARWAPSCFNEQPWRFITGIKSENNLYNKILSILAPPNREWAKSAPVLVLLVTKKTFSHNDKPNNWAEYDAGQAAAHLTVEAMAHGIHLHQMAGFNKDEAIKVFNISDNYQAVSVLALGYPDEEDQNPDELKRRERAQKKRLELDKILFTTEWQE